MKQAYGHPAAEGKAERKIEKPVFSFSHVSCAFPVPNLVAPGCEKVGSRPSWWLLAAGYCSPSFFQMNGVFSSSKKHICSLFMKAMELDNGMQAVGWLVPSTNRYIGGSERSQVAGWEIFKRSLFFNDYQNKAIRWRTGADRYIVPYLPQGA